MNKEISVGLTWGGGILVLALGAVLARKLGYVEPDTVTRLVIGANGLMVVAFGNRIPKTFTPSAQVRRVQRVAGWSQVLSGIIYTGLWAFAPMPVAAWGGTGAVLAGFAVTIGYCLSLRAKTKAAA